MVHLLLRRAFGVPALKLSWLFAALCGPCLLLQAQAVGTAFPSAVTTPTVYKVTLFEIDFLNDQGQWIAYYGQPGDLPVTLDIASVGPDSPVATLSRGRTLPDGTYSSIRVTFLRSIGMIGEVQFAADGQETVHTKTGLPANLTFEGLTGVSGASLAAEAATEQQVAVPFGAEVTAALNSVGITEQGNSLLVFTGGIGPFTVARTTPGVSVAFDVSDSLLFALALDDIESPVALPQAIKVAVSLQ